MNTKTTLASDLAVLNGQTAAVMPVNPAAVKVAGKDQQKKAEKPAVTKTEAKGEKPAQQKREGTKQAAAVEIFKREGGDRAKVVDAIMKEVGMSLAGATTYFYNAKKIVGRQEILAKIEKGE